MKIYPSTLGLALAAVIGLIATSARASITFSNGDSALVALQHHGGGNDSPPQHNDPPPQHHDDSPPQHNDPPQHHDAPPPPPPPPPEHHDAPPPPPPPPEHHESPPPPPPEHHNDNPPPAQPPTSPPPTPPSNPTQPEHHHEAPPPTPPPASSPTAPVHPSPPPTQPQPPQHGPTPPAQPPGSSPVQPGTPPAHPVNHGPGDTPPTAKPGLPPPGSPPAHTPPPILTNPPNGPVYGRGPLPGQPFPGQPVSGNPGVPGQPGRHHYDGSSNRDPGNHAPPTPTSPKPPHIPPPPKPVHHPGNDGSWDGYRCGYSAYWPFWYDDYFCAGLYEFQPYGANVEYSPWYSYDNLPGYVDKSQIDTGFVTLTVVGESYDWHPISTAGGFRNSDIDYAVDDLVSIFRDPNADTVERLIPTSEIGIQVEDQPAYGIKPSDFVDMMHDNSMTTKTKSYEVEGVWRQGDLVKVICKHTFLDPWNREQSLWHTYILGYQGRNLVIRQFGVSSTDPAPSGPGVQRQ